MSRIPSAWFVREYQRLLQQESPIQDNDVEALHHYRVALRRLRVLLRAFRKPLADTPARTLETRLHRLSKALGPARDADIRLQHFEQTLRALPMGQALLENQRFQQREERKRVKRLLKSASHRCLMRDVGHFLSGTLPIAMAAVNTSAWHRQAVKSLDKLLEQVLERGGKEPCLAPQPLHYLRIACRRARYLTEFFTWLGPDIRLLATRLKAAQDVLGTLHDLDVQIAYWRRQPAAAPELLRFLKARRRQAERRMPGAWKKLLVPTQRRLQR